MKKTRRIRVGAFFLASVLAFSSMTTLTVFAAVKQEENAQGTAQTIEQSAGLVFAEKLVMETPKALNTLELSGFKGSGTFSFQEAAFIPTKGVSNCLLVFTPDDINAFDYDSMAGWDADTKTIRRYVQVVCTSLKKAEEEKAKEESAGTPAVTATPEAAVTTVPESTETTVPETIVTAVPEATETTVPEATVTTVPEAAETTVPEGTVTAVPETLVTIVPEVIVTAVPEATVTIVPEATVTTVPEAAETTVPEAAAATEPKATASISPEAIAAGEQMRILTAEISSAEQVKSVLEAAKAYEALTNEQKAQVSGEALAALQAAQNAAAVYNHTSSGVTVSGNIPWYVRLLVSVDNQGGSYVPADLETIVPYDIKLWNLMTDSEYELSGGEKATLSMAVPGNLYLYDGLKVVHYLDNNRFEYLELRIEGGTMSFETGSFSSFSVAGSKPLVGGKHEKPGSSEGSSDKGDGSSSSQTGGKGSSSSKKTTSGKKDSVIRPVLAPRTGDSASMGLYITVGIAAAAICTGVVVTLIVRKKRK